MSNKTLPVSFMVVVFGPWCSISVVSCRWAVVLGVGGRWSGGWCSLDARKARHAAPKSREIGRGRDYPASIGPLAYSIGPSAHRNGPAMQSIT